MQISDFFSTNSFFDGVIVPFWQAKDILRNAMTIKTMIPFDLKVDYQLRFEPSQRFFLACWKEYQLSPSIAEEIAKVSWLLLSKEVDDIHPSHQSIYPMIQKLNQKSLIPPAPSFGNRRMVLSTEANVDYFYQNLPVVNVTKSPQKEELPIIECRNEEDQNEVLIQQIAIQLDQGIQPDQIVIIDLTGKNYYRLQQLSPLYGFSLGFLDSIPFELHPLGIQLKHLVHQFSNKESFMEVLSNLNLSNAVDFLKQKVLSWEEELFLYPELLWFNLRKITFPSVTEKNVVSYQSKMPLKFEPNVHYHMLSLNEGFFPNYPSEHGSFREEMKEYYHLPNQITRNQQLKENLASKIKEANQLTGYTTKFHNQQPVKISSFFEDCMIRITQKKSSPYFSTSAASLQYTKALYQAKHYDRYTPMYTQGRSLFPQGIPAYNPQFNGIHPTTNAFLLTGKNKISPTAIELYYHCPFHYLLSNLLKLDGPITNTAIDFGNAAHSILESAFDKSKIMKPLSFSSLKHRSLRYQEFVNENLIKKLHTILDELIRTLEPSAYQTIATELSLEHPILDTKESIYGKIDHVLQHQEHPNQVVILDYKTGSTGMKREDFSKGTNVQLIAYSYLQEKATSSDTQVMGFFHQPIPLGKINKEIHKSVLKEKMKLDGWMIQDPVKIKEITSLDRIKGIQLKNDGSFYDRSFNRLFSLQELDELHQEFEMIVKQFIQKRQNGEYTILPLPRKANQKISKSCEYCPHQGVCYLANKQSIDVESFDSADESEES